MSFKDELEKRLIGGKFRVLNEKLYKNKKLSKQETSLYHECYENQIKKWPINPLDLIIKKIKETNEKAVIADLGCGSASLSKSFENVHSFDAFPTSKNIVKCDMENVPLENNAVDMVVCCLSLMKQDITKTIREVSRILRKNGFFYLAEVRSRFSSINKFCDSVKFNPMIWTEKYKPKNLSEFAGNRGTIDIISKYNLENIPHLLIHGLSGAGKRSLVKCLMTHLFGHSPVSRIRKSEIKNNSKTISVSYIEADEYIEISPSEYGYQDKLIIQTVIKEMTQSKPIMSLFSKNKRPSLKIIVITSAENLSFEAQAALRRTIEVYSSCFRIFLVCSQLSKIIEPIRSRCLFFRLEGLNNAEMSEILMNIIKQENSLIGPEQVGSLVKDCNGNLRRAITKLELLDNKTKSVDKRKKSDNNVKLDWELELDEIVGLIKRNLQSEVMHEVRKRLYLLLNSCIPPDFVLIELYKRFVAGKDLNDLEKILDLALIYEERIKSGSKGVFHIEAFIIGVMCVFKKLI